MIRFAETCSAVAATSSTLEKVTRLAEYLSELDDADLSAATRFFTGNVFGAHEQRRLSVGSRTLIAAAERIWGIDERSLTDAYRATGDLGDALGRLRRSSLDLGLWNETLSPAGLKKLLDEVADAKGSAAGKRRVLLCERILRATASELEARYVLKVLLAELRIGLREGLVLDAIARAFGRDPTEVRRAAMAAGDPGEVAVAGRYNRLSEVGPRYGSPIAFMLATPVLYGSSYRELSEFTWLVEDKFDGIRAQAHKRGETVSIFSRTHSEIGASFPEIVAELVRQPGDFIVDGEIVARRGELILPFRYLQQRLSRVAPEPELLEAVPASFITFDLLAEDDTFLVDLPLVERRAALEDTIRSGRTVLLAPAIDLAGAGGSAALDGLFEAARARCNEGLVLKRVDAHYAPGRRGKWWLKLKRELSTLDVVVVAVEWGHGKRHRVLSDYTFAVRESPASQHLLTIGKAYTGLTDAEIARMTSWFLEHRTGARRGHAIEVEPTVVLEVAFDIVQKSTLHDSGYALRFPRIVRLRPDKPAAEIDTLAGLERIYAAMLEREGVER